MKREAMNFEESKRDIWEIWREKYCEKIIFIILCTQIHTRVCVCVCECRGMIQVPEEDRTGYQMP